MTQLKLYDTATRMKVPFTPREPDRITMYLCGPTVYGRAHIGNARPAVVFDVLARLLRHLYPDHRLDYARNITDVDDKIIAAAAAEGVDPKVITDRYERHYLEDTAALGVEAPPIQPRATAHVTDMIAMIARLIDLGHAYAAQGHVLFSVASDPGYGSLSRRDAEALRAGARVEVAPYKRDAGDFVLWKPSAPEVIGWNSPWGRGRPGWHIECSAMIERHLGRTIDIHAGGLDLIFPHHENEAAQSRSAHGGDPLANIWMHNGFLNMGGGEKMSKSLGNVATIDELLDAHDGALLRLALLSSHYRQPLNWTDQVIVDAGVLLSKARDALSYLERPIRAHVPDRFIDWLNDDLNTPKAIDYLWTKLRRTNAAIDFSSMGSALSAYMIEANELLACFQLMGLSTPTLLSSRQIDIAVLRRIDKRTEAKKLRDFAEADRIRAELVNEGVILEDTPTGTTWRRA